MKSIADLEAIRAGMHDQMTLRRNPSDEDINIVVGMATCGLAAGAREVFDTFVDEICKAKKENVKVSRSGCVGNCEQEPIVEVSFPGQEKVVYVKVTKEAVSKIVSEHIINGKVCTEYTAK